MPVKPQPPEAPALESMDGEFKVRSATMRGVTYVVQELGADEYQACLTAATSEDGRTIDNSMMFKLMLNKALREPKAGIAEVLKKPYPVVRKLNDIIDELHYTPEETAEEAEAKAKEEAAEARKKAGEAKG